ncbi:HARBI1 [Mytilus coruscus]|uniref:HARBI1 n=1 Tax=Mytilus coruscus TaxID=42192 RepID=A0A6J8ELV6_MYTCO|nr:HARBI1 [Mytilus coruscus]
MDFKLLTSLLILWFAYARNSNESQHRCNSWTKLHNKVSQASCPEGKIYYAVWNTHNETYIEGCFEIRMVPSGLDKSTVSRVVDSVLDALCEKRNEFIQWPTNLNQTKAEFYEIAGFPNILGAVDGTHIRIKRPHHDEASFINRKSYPSLNVQAICDAKDSYGSQKMVYGILHNICIQLNEPDVAAEEPVNEDVENGINYNGQQDRRGIREHIAETYFNRH